MVKGIFLNKVHSCCTCKHEDIGQSRKGEVKSWQLVGIKTQSTLFSYPGLIIFSIFLCTRKRKWLSPITWLRAPCLCSQYSATELWQLDKHQPLHSSICMSQVVPKCLSQSVILFWIVRNWLAKHNNRTTTSPHNPLYVSMTHLATTRYSFRVSLGAIMFTYTKPPRHSNYNIMQHHACM